MSGASSSGVGWFTRLEPARLPEFLFQRADDPRLGEVIEAWKGDPAALTPGRAVLVGFPQEEGVRRNHGRPGTAEAPHEVRQWLYRLTPWDPLKEIDLAEHRPLDAGNVHLSGSLEETQQVLGEVVAGILQAGAVPVVLGGGHETAYGLYLGHVAAGQSLGIINLDAHLDLRPPLGDLGHSGSPFRQALEHPTHPLPGDRYVCLGAQPGSVSREHIRYARDHRCVLRWGPEVQGSLAEHFTRERNRLGKARCQVHVSVDADVVRMADVPGVSAPNPLGLSGEEVVACARLAGESPQVASFELVELNPRYDRDGQSARWGALVLWHFLVGLASR